MYKIIVAFVICLVVMHLLNMRSYAQENSWYLHYTVNDSLMNVDSLNMKLFKRDKNQREELLSQKLTGNVLKFECIPEDNELVINVVYRKHSKKMVVPKQMVDSGLIVAILYKESDCKLLYPDDFSLTLSNGWLSTFSVDSPD